MTNEAKKLAHFLEEERRRSTHDHADAANEPQRLTPQEILRKLKDRNYGSDAGSTATPSAKTDARTKPHPRKTVVTSLKRFMSLRDDKIKRQVDEGGMLSRAGQARVLAQRLADPAQVAKYIDELNQQADDCIKRYQARLNESNLFWYGPDGLQWLAAKKSMRPTDWLAYAEFMDEAALRALAALIERDLIERFMKSAQ